MSKVIKKEKVIKAWAFLDKEGELLFVAWEGSKEEAIEDWHNYGDDEDFDKIVPCEIKLNK